MKKMKKIDFKKITRKDMDYAVKELKKGLVLAYPSDTIYGLGCDARNKKAIERIYEIKEREKKHPLLILVNDFLMLKKYCFCSKEQEKKLKKIWNKESDPTTVVLKSKNILPSELSGGFDSIAVRMINNNSDLQKRELLTKIIKGLGAPLVSTSLNKSGKDDIFSLENLEDYFKKDKPDIVIDAGYIKKRKASRVIDLRDIKNIKIIRD
jgi:L-threonylcarbamoyladenylate synthase